MRPGPNNWDLTPFMQGEVEETLARIWAELLKIEKVGRNDNFFELGGHSLLAVQLVGRVERELSVEVPLVEFFKSPSVVALAGLILGLAVDVGKTSRVSILRQGKSSTSLFCVHAVDGGVDYAVRLARHITDEINVYGVTALGLQSNEVPLESIQEMAKVYVDAIRSIQPIGPYRIAGWSSGGLVAYEMAIQIINQGESVDFIGLIDTVLSEMNKQKYNELIEKWMIGREKVRENYARANLLMLIENMYGEGDAKLLDACDKVQDIFDSLAQNKGFDGEIKQFMRLHATQYACLEAANCYIPPTGIKIPTYIFAATESQKDDQLIGWGDILSHDVRLVSLAGNHESIVSESNISHLGRKLSEALCKDFGSKSIDSWECND